MADWTSTVAGVTPANPDPAPGRARLHQLVVAAEAATPAAAVAMIADLLASPEAIRELAVTARLDAAGLSALLMRLGAIKHLRPRVTTLEKVIRESAERMAKLEADARYQAALGRGSEPLVLEALRRCLGDHALPAGLRCPPGWELTPDGLFRVRLDPEDEDASLVEVAHRPLVVEGRLRDVEEDAVHLLLGWPTAGAGWRTVAVPRIKVADARQLVSLADLDAPVNSNNAGQLVAYLDDFESANAEHIPEAGVTARMGWHEARDREGRKSLCFLWGRSVLRAGGERRSPAGLDRGPATWEPGELRLLTNDPGIRGLADGFRAAGTLDGWRETVRHALPFPRAMLLLYAALVPPLMPFLPTLPNFIVDFSGETSRGKTTALRLAASVWGCPDERGGGIVHTWDTTRVFVERAAALCDHLPLFLDDTKRARRREDVGKTLFDFASGVGRGRGSLLGLQRVTRAHGVLLSTGEAPATSYTDDGGTRARTLSLWGSPFDGTGAPAEAAVAELHRGMLLHHGHAGPRLVSWLIDRPEARDSLATALERELAYWSQLTNGNPVAGRAARYIAALSIARGLFHQVLDVPSPERDPLLDAWDAVRASTVEADRASEALRAVLSWAASQQHRFYGRSDYEPGTDPAPHAGWLGAWSHRVDWAHIAFLPNELSAFLARSGYDTEAILRTWNDRAWLLRDDEHRSKKVTVGTRKPRCVVVRREACDHVGGGD